MTYTDADDLDFARLEREAYIRGDMTVAQLAAVAMDRSADVADLEKQISDLEDEIEHLKSKGPDEPAPARPEHPGKDARHLPAVNRHGEPTARIYAMPKSKPKQEPKRPRGRPAIEGRRVVIKLEERQIKAAEKLGGGNVAAGIRAALARTG